MTEPFTKAARRTRAALAAALLAAPLLAPAGVAAEAGPTDPAATSEAPVTLAVFHACNALRGCEMWITDGTRPNTRILRDIVRGNGASNPQNLTALGDGRVVFAAHQPPGHTGFDYQPWITDGTAAGTRRIRRTATHAVEMAPRDFTPLGDGRAIFIASGDGGATQELTMWVTGGARVGTRPILAIEQGAGAYTGLGNGLAVFSHTTAEHGAELWVTDGTPRRTRLLQDINPGTASSFQGWFPIAALGDGRALFRATDGVHGDGLWVTDGTRRGTRMVADLTPGAGASLPRLITPIGGGRALFVAERQGGGTSIWITDGTGAGTQRVVDNLVPSEIVHLGDGLALFAARSDELWITDATEAGTRRVRVVPGVDGNKAAIAHLRPLGDGRAVFWQTQTWGEPYQLWVTDGTAAGTRRIGTAGTLHITGLNQIRSLGDGRAIFPRQDHRGIEPWVTDGTREGTRLLRDINPGGEASHSYPREFTVLGSFPPDHELARALAAAGEATSDD